MHAGVFSNNGTTIPHVRSSSNLPTMAVGCLINSTRNANNATSHGDPIYAMPVKPFLSSQDVRNAVARQCQRVEVCTATAAIDRNYCSNVTVFSLPSLKSQPGNVSGLNNGILEQPMHHAKVKFP